ncbi:MAG: S41 family peptidase [Prolixibacteraceae bacterium]|nr:S41 family peptidase [Prolixibacteraceae bacterium]
MKYLINKQFKGYIFRAFIIVLLISGTTVSAQQSVRINQSKISGLIRLVGSYYVDTVDIDKITEDAIEHILSELDPHSTYISKEEVDKMNEPLQGNFEGIGITFNIFKDTLMVNTTIAGGPSEKVGLRAGDRIIEVDNKKVAGIGLNNTDVYDLLRGQKGTEVDLKILRKNNPEYLDFTVIRDKIPIYSLDASYMIDESTGFIKLSRFSATTTQEFRAAMKKLEEQNIKNLILDLRGNGGGYLTTAIEISDEFLKDNRLIVYTSGVNEPKREYTATSTGEFEQGNLVVLIDESSASASEIVTGAVQDWDRGIVIGRRSFGKGLVQKQIPLADGSVVRLTTAHYYTPSGRCIQKPYENGVEDYRNDFQHRVESGELFNADSIVFDDSLQYKTLTNGRSVYGGGGVMPDIFVSLDTSQHYRYVNKLRGQSIIRDYAVEYLDSHREKLQNEYPDFDKFDKKFIVSDGAIDEIVALGEKENIEKDEESIKFSGNDIKKEIKALIARDLFSNDDFYKVYYKDDEAILTALKVLKNQEDYNNVLVSVE